MSTYLYVCECWDDLSEFNYIDHRCYRTREDAERRARRLTYVEDQVGYHARVVAMKACWEGQVMGTCYSIDKDEYRTMLEDLERLKVDNEKLRELVRDFLYEHEDYFAEGNYFIGDIDLEHAMQHNHAVFRRKARELGVDAE